MKAECLENKYIVFSTEAELKHHLATEHPQKGQRSLNRQAQTIEAGYYFENIISQSNRENFGRQSSNRNYANYQRNPPKEIVPIAAENISHVTTDEDILIEFGNLKITNKNE